MKRRPIKRSLRFAILERDGFTCRYCGRSAPDVELHVDHKKPVAGGGGDEWENLVTACLDCNLGKAALQLIDNTDDLHERAIGASMIRVAVEQFGAAVDVRDFEMLLDFSGMNGPQPRLVDLIRQAPTWGCAVSKLYEDAGYPEGFW